MSEKPVRVLIVEDEPMMTQSHIAYLQKVGGFEVVGTAANAREAVRVLRASRSGGEAGRNCVDLVLVDMNLPDVHGIELCRQLRASGADIDLIAITAVRDVAVVRQAVSLGIVQYLIKPFSFSSFATRMHAYLQYREGFSLDSGATTQSDVDRTLAALRSAPQPELDKGLSAESLQVVLGVLRASAGARSAVEVSVEARVSRITARRYLEYLVATGVAAKSARYGTPGRPEIEYRLL